jgi:hypothetical protein
MTIGVGVTIIAIGVARAGIVVGAIAFAAAMPAVIDIGVGIVGLGISRAPFAVIALVARQPPVAVGNVA